MLILSHTKIVEILTYQRIFDMNIFYPCIKSIKQKSVSDAKGGRELRMENGELKNEKCENMKMRR